jgi:hypothetical protein
VTGSRPRSAPPGFDQIREPSFYVGLIGLFTPSIVVPT